MEPHSLWYSSDPLIIAHRGASRRAPENTVAAFRLAAELGADAIELDAKLTADGHVVILHDQTLDRTTGGQGRVADHTLAQVKALEAGAHFSAEFAGEPVPTLEEVLEAVGSRLLVNVEMGNYATPMDRLPEVVVEAVRRQGLQGRVLLSSFNPLALRRAARVAPDIPRALLLKPGGPSWLRLAFLLLSRGDFVNLHESLVTAQGVARHVRSGRRVIAWTVNDPARMEDVLRSGVHGLITDEPDVARGALDDVRRRR